MTAGSVRGCGRPRGDTPGSGARDDERPPGGSERRARRRPGMCTPEEADA